MPPNRGMLRWLMTIGLVLLAPAAWAQDTAAPEPRKLTRDEKSAAKEAIKAALQAGDDTATGGE